MTAKQTIKQLREARGWKQMDLAYHAGVSLSTVSNIEAGQQDPRVGIAQKLADTLSVTLDAIEWVHALERRPRKKKAATSPDE